MRIKEFKTITFGTTDLETIESSFRHIDDVKGLLLRDGVGAKSSKKFLLVVDASHEYKLKHPGFDKRVVSGTDKIDTAIKLLKDATYSSVWGEYSPEIIITK